ncbi:fungal-specific transcription factor domain-containing protein [Astrocystis sublimbata]|nr:fungal-specific transcription factor domain-containing protein [Astrocystis sublimbata]
MSEESPISPDSASSRSRYSQKRDIGTISALSHHDSEDEGRRKAYKASRACDTCKAKKARCSGTIPCDRCVLRRLKCAYDAVYSRGRPPTPPPAKRFSPRQSSVAVQETIRVDPERPQPEQRMDEPRVSSSEGLPPPSGVMNTTSQAAEGEGQYLDDTGITFLHRAYRRLAMHQRRSMNPHVLSGAEPLQHITWTGDKPLRLGTSRLEGTEPLSLCFSVHNVRTVVQAYFDTCVVTYRMFHKSTVLGWLDVAGAHLDPEAHAPSQVHTDAHRLFPLSFVIGNAKASILLTLMSITTLREEKTKNRFDSTWDEEQALPQTDQYFQLASAFTDSEVGPATLESGQARLIQVLYLLQTARMNRAWHQLGTAYQIIAALGLHRKQNSWGQEGANNHVNGYMHNASNTTSISASSSDYIALQCQLRTFWVAYSMDVYMSVVLGRPRYFHDDDINQTFPASIDDEDMAPYGPINKSQDPSIISTQSTSDGRINTAGNIDFFNYSQARLESNTDSMIAHAQLSRIIASVSHSVYSLKPLAKRERLAAARRCGQSLRDWRAGLATHIKSIHPSSLIPSLRRQAIALQLAYCHAVIHTHRPFLLGTEEVDEHTRSGEETPEDYVQAVDESAVECISAARTALHIVETIASDTSVVNALWWTPYVLFCALAVVYVWEIEQNARRKTTAQNGGNGNRDTSRRARDSGNNNFQDLLALAERCHVLLSHDLRSSADSSSIFSSQTADSPSRRYSIILEELRLEARRHSGEDVPLSPQPVIPLRTTNSTTAATPLSRHQQNTMSVQTLVQEENNASNGPDDTALNDTIDIYDASAMDTAGTGLLPIMFQEWQTSDWLGLDASVSYFYSFYYYQLIY